MRVSGIVYAIEYNRIQATTGHKIGHSRLLRGWPVKHLINAIADLEGVGVAFVSLRDNLVLTTPSGRLMVQIFGAMAEFERALIQERVRAGLPNARAKGKRLGRPRVVVDATRITALRASGASWRKISRQLGVGIATLYRQAAGG